MRKLIVAMAFASTAIAAPLHAQDHGPYIEVDGGGVMVNNITVPTLDPSGTGVFDTKTGYDVGGILGYDFGAFRIEAEASYRRAGADRYTVGSTVYDGANLTGRASAMSYMGNALLDFGSDHGLRFSIGGGAGYGRVHESIIAANRTDNLSGHDWGFAWQGLAAVRMAITDTIDVGLKYRFYNQNKVDLVNDAGQPSRTRFRSHSALLTLGLRFGGSSSEPEPAPAPPPPPAEVAPPPPPPPPPVAQCNTGPYIVFFDWNRSDITPEAAGILDSAVSAYGNCNNVPIMLAGYADRSGSASYNIGLSERRAASVQSYLVAHGVAGGSITARGYGETNPRVPTADGVRELQNRRVEITYGPGSGM